MAVNRYRIKLSRHYCTPNVRRIDTIKILEPLAYPVCPTVRAVFSPTSARGRGFERDGPVCIRTNESVSRNYVNKQILS